MSCGTIRWVSAADMPNGSADAGSTASALMSEMATRGWFPVYVVPPERRLGLFALGVVGMAFAVVFELLEALAGFSIPGLLVGAALGAGFFWAARVARRLPDELRTDGATLRWTMRGSSDQCATASVQRVKRSLRGYVRMQMGSGQCLYLPVRPGWPLFGIALNLPPECLEPGVLQSSWIRDGIWRTASLHDLSWVSDLDQPYAQEFTDTGH
jgi:hypothetical protein